MLVNSVLQIQRIHIELEALKATKHEMKASRAEAVVLNFGLALAGIAGPQVGAEGPDFSGFAGKSFVFFPARAWRRRRRRRRRRGGGWGGSARAKMPFSGLERQYAEKGPSKVPSKEARFPPKKAKHFQLTGLLGSLRFQGFFWKKKVPLHFYIKVFCSSPYIFSP